MIFYSPFWCRVSLSDWLKKIDFCRLAPILVERFLYCRIRLRKDCRVNFSYEFDRQMEL